MSNIDDDLEALAWKATQLANQANGMFHLLRECNPIDCVEQLHAPATVANHLAGAASEFCRLSALLTSAYAVREALLEDQGQT